MDFADFTIRRLSSDDDLDPFTCGDDDLDEFIRNDAFDYLNERLAISYVVGIRNEIVAYFSIANDRLSYDDFENSTSFNRFRKRHFVNSKRIKGYPAVKLCRLAVKSSHKGKKIGTFIINFIKGLFYNENKSACRFLTVDANESALRFYSSNGFNFILTTINEGHRTIPLYFDLADFSR